MSKLYAVETNGDYLYDLRTVAAVDITPLKSTLVHLFKMAGHIRSNPRNFSGEAVAMAELVNNMSLVMLKKPLTQTPEKGEYEQ